MRTVENHQSVEKSFSPAIILILAAACGLIVANLYYAQPLIGPISEDLGLSSGAAGLIVTLAQIGYGLGLLFLVPLGDIVENRKLVVILLVLAAIALALGGGIHNASLFLLASMLIGMSSVAAQVLVPYAAHLSPEATRGRNVGNVMSGLLLGIMLARPVSSLVAEYMGWRAVYYLSAAAILLLALVLLRALPVRKPSTSTRYSELMGSMLHLLKSTPILQRRALYHACVFGTFSLFWTTVPLYLTGPAFHFSQQEVALFALVGVSGALAAPFAGRLADRGWIRPGTGIALVLVLASMALPLIDQSGSTFALILLLVAAIVLDMGVSANLVLSQRTIFSLGDEIRSRLNGLFMAIFFAGGAIGSALGGWAYAAGGWNAALWIGIILPTLALVYYLTEKRS
ncbi:putative MFS family arabinose efflux permease [Paenibacillus cellulosilyticus]|uniref:Putative MFS family arabinose efflux permease n=1 Tax=Paenibacillus cellulosilyticus TaxID=375489 RepID=A0A2V2Z9F7_9BACL|nr:MFS transporter [Paenibacillus cellulosilyticus]PWW08751.1 putative MFS family arabinose efflux permease [Paenibacillus cellulosilyticus]QKS48310.1 MFS transporter [Paenibacillus cellulosilyticus]